MEDSITWPVRKIIPIVPGDYRSIISSSCNQRKSVYIGDITSHGGIFASYSYLELRQVGILEVKLIEAKDLTNKDIIGKSDPFVELFIRPLRDRLKTSKTIVRILTFIY